MKVVSLGLSLKERLEAIMHSACRAVGATERERQLIAEEVQLMLPSAFYARTEDNQLVHYIGRITAHVLCSNRGR